MMLFEFLEIRNLELCQNFENWEFGNRCNHKKNLSFLLLESRVDCNLGLETRNLRIVVIIVEEKGEEESVIDFYIIGDLCVAKLSFLFIGEQAKNLTMQGGNTRSDNMDVRRMNILRRFENSSFFYVTFRIPGARNWR